MTPAGAVLALDLGGTEIKALLIDSQGRQLAASAIPTPVDQGPDAVLRALVALGAEVAGAPGVAVRAVGLVVPGAVDTESGVSRYAANLGWRDLPVRDLVARELGLPVAFGHDVGAAALAERTVGAARGVADCLVVVIGTGIAAVSIAGAAVLRGARRLAGELGHVPVRPGGERCACGQRGCLEAYASARAIAARYRRATGVACSSREIAARRTYDAAAARVWREAVAALADALTSVTMLQDPELIIIAGGLSEAGPALLQPLRAAVAERIAWRAAPDIRASGLGARAGAVGAAVQAWELVGDTEFAQRVSAGRGT